MRKLFFLVLLIFITISVATAQKKNSKEKDIETTFGYIPAKDLLMTTYALDSSAEAVVLASKGEMFIEPRYGQLKLTYHFFRRVKLLKKSAFNQGNVNIVYKSKGGYEEFRRIEAAVIQPDGIRQELTKKDFFQEKSTDDFTTKKIVFPNLSEGCIIEYDYTLESGNIVTLKPWFFQEDIPVRHSEIWISMPEYYDYVYLFRGRHSLKKERIRNHTLDETFTLSTLKMYADSIPALKIEPYITTMNDYLSQVSFQLSRAKYSEIRVKDYLTNWKALAEEVAKNNKVGSQYLKKSNYGDIWEVVKPLLAGVKSEDEKIKIVYDYIANNMTWSEQFSPSTYTSLNDAFMKKKANSGELNMMLIACLLEAGVKALPMFVSTRENGKPFAEYPIIEQFNHIACYIERGEKSLILDAGNSFRPVGLPRVATLNGRGWVVEGQNSRWVSVIAPLSTNTSLANFTLNGEGVLQGSISNNYRGYAAVSEREEERIEAKNHEKVKKDLAKDFPDIKIDSITIANLENNAESFKRMVYCAIPNGGTTAGDLMYIKPTLKTGFDINPFKQTKREYPIEFAYPFKDQFILNLTIPNDYKVEELPKPIRVNLPKDGGVFQYLSTLNGNVIQLVVKIQLDQLHFEPEEYPLVKQFFNQIAIKSAEQIVLKKK
jgi:hypothetical protein